MSAEAQGPHTFAKLNKTAVCCTVWGDIPCACRSQASVRGWCPAAKQNRVEACRWSARAWRADIMLWEGVQKSHYAGHRAKWLVQARSNKSSSIAFGDGPHAATSTSEEILMVVLQDSQTCLHRCEAQERVTCNSCVPQLGDID